jgi:DNA-binding NarL/FixJ family response regulator
VALAVGYLLKDASRAELAEAVRDAARGKTMKTHLLRAFNKLGVSDRTAAVTTAMSLGLLS